MAVSGLPGALPFVAGPVSCSGPAAVVVRQQYAVLILQGHHWGIAGGLLDSVSSLESWGVPVLVPSWPGNHQRVWQGFPLRMRPLFSKRDEVCGEVAIVSPMSHSLEGDFQVAPVPRLCSAPRRWRSSIGSQLTQAPSRFLRVRVSCRLPVVHPAALSLPSTGALEHLWYAAPHAHS